MRHVITLKFSDNLLLNATFKSYESGNKKVLIPKIVTNVADAVYLPCYQAQRSCEEQICIRRHIRTGFVQIARPCSCNRIIMIPYVAIYTTTTVIIINDAIISIIVSVSLLPRFLPFFS